MIPDIRASTHMCVNVRVHACACISNHLGPTIQFAKRVPLNSPLAAKMSHLPGCCT